LEAHAGVLAAVDAFLGLPGAGGVLLGGLLTNVELWGTSLAVAVVVGGALAVGGVSRVPVVSRGSRALAYLFRTQPPLLLLYFFVYGLRGLLAGDLSPFFWAALALGLVYGALAAGILLRAAGPSGETPTRRLVRRASLLLDLRETAVALLLATPIAYAVAVPEGLYAIAHLWGDGGNRPLLLFLLLFAFVLAAQVTLVGLQRGARILPSLRPPAPRAASQPLRNGLLLALVVLLWATDAHAQSRDGSDLLGSLLRWMPVVFEGFLLNVLLAVVALAIAMASAPGLCLLALSPKPLLGPPVRLLLPIARCLAPLPLLFFGLFLFPQTLNLVGRALPLPDWLPAAIILAIPATTALAHRLRTTVHQLPPEQWYAAGALGLDRRQSLRLVVMPQVWRRQVPFILDLTATLVAASTLTSLVGVEEAVSLSLRIQGDVPQPGHAMSLFGTVMLWFLLLCHPLRALADRVSAAQSSGV